MRVMLADHKTSVRTALRLFLQEQDGVEIVSEVSRIGELLRDAPLVLPDLIFLDWELPDFKSNSFGAYIDKNMPGRSINQAKAVVISSLHCLASRPIIIVTCNQPEERLKILTTGADAFVDQGELPVQILSILQVIREKHLLA
jgi:DNA-binding NarL/FixJ family response regulator